LRTALERTRKLMFDLRPPLLHEHGLRPAVEDLARELSGETAARVECDVSSQRLPATTEQLVYRSIREAVANIRKHANARRVEISVEVQNGSVFGRVADDGSGFDPAIVPTGRMGLSAARERIDVAGGALEIESRPGGGTNVMFRVPVFAGHGPLSVAV
jgi:signal transduction histidine kinase